MTYRTGSYDRPGIFRNDGRKEPSGGTIKVRRGTPGLVFRKNSAADVKMGAGKLSFHDPESGHWGYADSKSEAIARVNAAKKQETRVRRGGERTYNRDDKGRFA